MRRTHGEILHGNLEMNIEIQHYSVSELTCNRNSLVTDFILFLCECYEVSPEYIRLEFTDFIKYHDDSVGVCYELMENTRYRIVVKTKERTITQIFATIAHEFIHVKQYLKDNLRGDVKSGHKIPYEERWWEIEAFEDCYSLVKKFIERI